MIHNLTKFRLSQHIWQRREFDPKKPADLEEYCYFLQHQRWKSTCPFLLEWPFTDMFQMIEHKIVREHIDTLISATSASKTKK
jgi:hypothetical protein